MKSSIFEINRPEGKLMTPGGSFAFGFDANPPAWAKTPKFKRDPLHH